MWKTILNLIFPISCLGCGKEGLFICPDCFTKIPLKDNSPSRLDLPPGIKRLIIASDFNHPLLKEAIYRYKYDFVKGLAPPLAQLMSQKLKSVLAQKRNCLLIPVPLHKRRLRWRGFNQAELLAQEISQELDIPILTSALVRSKHTLPQVKIENAQARKINIREAFGINQKFKNASIIQNKNIVLIDDICTTGATLEECARALSPLNPKEIWGLVLARG